MISTRAIYNQLELGKAKMIATKEENKKLEAQLAKRIRLSRTDTQGRRFGIKDGVKRLEIEKNGLSFPDFITAITDLVPQTRHKKIEQIRRKLGKPYKYSSYSRAE